MSLTRAIVLSLAVLGASTAPVAASSLATDKAVFEDPTGRLTFEEVRTRTFRPYRAFLNEGYTSSVFWIRLTIRPVPAAEDLPESPGAGWAIIRMRPVFIDQVELFDPADASGRRRLAGDRFEWGESEHLSLAHTFVIRVGPQPRQVWLRMQTTSAKHLHVDVLPWQEAVQLDRQDELRASLIVVLLVTLALGGLVAALTTHTATDYAFAAMQAANLPYALYVLGYVRPLTSGLVPARVLDTGFNVAVFVAIHVSCWFYYFFITEHRPSRLGRWLVALPLSFLPILLWLMIAGYLELALFLNAITVGVLPMTMLVASITCRAWQPNSEVRPTLPRWLYLGASIAAALGAVMWFVSVSGWMKSTYFLLYGMIWFTALIGTVMLGVLLVRARGIAATRTDALLRAQIAESRALQAGQKRAEQAELLSMLAHEVKTGLSVIRMALAPAASTELRAVADEAVDGIGRALDRCSDEPRVTEPEMFSITASAARPLLESIRVDSAAPSRVVTSVDHDLEQIVTDSVTLRRLLALLVENALMHGAQDAPVDLVASVDRRQGGGVLIWTSNLPGTSGWPDPAQVFAKYYRSPGARRLTGSGLGLHLAATLATQLGGELRYAPSATHVRFVLWLSR